MFSKVINPATEEVVAELLQPGSESVALAVAGARAAQSAWSERPLSARIQALKSFRDGVEANAAALARTLTVEVGKPLSQASGEVRGTIGRLDFFIEKAAEVLAFETVHSAADGRLTEQISHEPLGVVANISAWNYPWFVGVNVFAPALLAGNAVIYKPSEFASLTGLAIGNLLYDAGVPRAIFPVLIGGAEVGEALLAQDIDGVFFTGSYRTGRLVNEAVASKLIKVQLELGGKDPVYVREDSDPRIAAGSLADGAFFNTGQSCCAVERIYVHHSIHEAFVAAFIEAVEGFVVADPLDEGAYIGPLTQASHLDLLDAQVKDALDKGARLHCGGHRLDRRGNYFAPTVFTGVDHTMRLMREETFGPLIGIMAVEDDAQAIALMNDTPYGLTAGVYTPDGARARQLLARINAGTAYWNCCDRVSPRLPWSGRGHSGLGLTLSTYGISAFTRPRAWHLRR